MTNKEWDSIQAKLANLKTLSEQGATAGESAAAAAALQRLLFKYNLTMADVKPVSEDDFVRERYNIGVTFSSIWSRWQYDLMFVVARNNFCQALYNPSGGKFCSIIGEPHNIEIVKGMYEYLAGEIKRLMHRDLKVAKATGAVGFNTDNWRYSYRQTAIWTIGQRLAEQRKIDTEQYTGGSALVVVEDAALKNAMERLAPKAKDGRAKGANAWNVNGAVAGKAAAHEISLNKQVAAEPAMALA